MKREHKTTEEILQELKGRSKNGLLRRFVDRSAPVESAGAAVPKNEKKETDIEDLLSSIFDE
jgi:hypothetical protein